MNHLLLPGETIVEKKICALSGEEFIITDKDIAFYESVSPIIGGSKYFIPTPTLSPTTRMQRRMAFRNERYLYEKPSCFTGKTLVTMYHPEEDWKICETKIWHSDSWSAFEYGRKIDFERPFLEQVMALWKDVPMMNLYHTGNSENCEYTNWFGGGKTAAKNCYLCFNGAVQEDCMFCKGLVEARDCLDIYFGSKDEHCYECINCNECYDVYYSEDCTNCRECQFCSSCIGCQNCFGCINLNGQQYCMFNEKLGKETYEKRLSELRLTHKTLPLIQQKVYTFFQTQPVRCHHNIHCENVQGDYLVNCKDVIGFEVFNCENVKYVGSSKHTKDSMDMNGYGYYSDHLLESCGSGNSSQMCFTACCDISSEVYYSAWCLSTNHLFGCVGIKHGQYAVLNTSMSQQEYETLVPKIIDHMRSTGEWGEFFDPKYSPFGYNETIGFDDQPLDRETIKKYGWRWYDAPKKERVMQYYTPQDIREYNPIYTPPAEAEKNIADLLAGTLQCELSGEPFRILREELRFYMLHDLPIPRRHPQTRYNDRIHHMNPKKLRETSCKNCASTLLTTYQQGREILCEECYRKNVY